MSRTVHTLCGVFFVSGAAGLVFETLWFRQAGLAFGNGLVASSLVLSSFMVGLALGNGLAARWGPGLRRPVRVYAGLEVAIAVTGAALVFGLPSLGGAMGALRGALGDAPLLRDAVRFVLSFALLVVPSTAMGATLPLLVKALVEHEPSFGAALGRLYGWNTLGAVLGAFATEAWLVGWLGVRGTGLAAASANLAAAAGALALASRLTPTPPVAARAPAPPRLEPPRGRAARRLGAAFLGGGLLLALEVLWFRFLHLYVSSGSLAFAVMLATVLAGIGVGGFVGGAALRRHGGAHRHAASVALLAGSVVVATYAGFARVLAPLGDGYMRDPLEVLPLALALTFPTSLLSGVLFTLVGTALHDELRSEARSAGLAVLANTFGAGVGSLLGGLVLIPLLGMEGAFFVLAALYAVVAALLWDAGPARASAAPRWRSAAAPAALFAAALLLFPFGRMHGLYLRIPAERHMVSDAQRVVAVHEGRTETLLYLRRDFLGEPLSMRLLTDGFSMSATSARARRYMKLFVWWPRALAPDPRQALLISYGLGSTAKALVETPALERLDVVDTSRDVLETSAIVFPDPAEHPLRDPRVHVHVEDGRHFLQTTSRRYDLITGEPPPPKNAGIVNLYTREHFALIRERLAEGGISTYWLPVHNLFPSDAKAIIRAYCEVFRDCSLWVGNDLDWMLVGSRDARWSRDPDHVARLWEEPHTAAELRAVGLEVPAQLGALFLGDAAFLRALTRDTAPLVDDRPKRLSDGLPAADPGARRTFLDWMDPTATRQRFRTSEFVRDAWPPALREHTLAWFPVQQLLNPGGRRRARGGDVLAHLAVVDRLLRDTSLHTLVLWQLGSGVEEQAIARRVAAREPSPEAAVHLALGALAERDYARASATFEEAPLSARAPLLRAYRLYALCRAGRGEKASQLAHSTGVGPDDGGSFCPWLEGRLARARGRAWAAR